MKPHTTSLEISRRLKDLNVPQISEFYYNLDIWGNTLHFGKPSDNDNQIVSAFLASELMEMMPFEIFENRPNQEVFGKKPKSHYYDSSFEDKTEQINDSYGVDEYRAYSISYGLKRITNRSYPNALGLMLIYLIEQGLYDRTRN